ncbi:MAG: adenylosuccinate lyase [Sphingobacteriales bacterium]|nr:MAG: adenylosuccinate lyase [Sphingobacteriales bacterium]
MTPLTAISSIDGRYRAKVAALAPYFSEFGLIRYRVWVEVEYFLALAEAGVFALPETLQPTALRALYQNFSEADATEIKTLERTTNHDVKAVEYFLKSKLTALGGESVQEWIHFGLTSQDVNNTANPMLFRDALETIYYPKLESIITILHAQARDWSNIPMLARTHGQPASPTTLGREWAVFAERLEGQLELLKAIPHRAKFGGATGGFNAHTVTFPETNWTEFGNRFVSEKLGLSRTQRTTQIEPYDHLAAQLDGLKRINTILIDFARDVWTYVSLEYFKQKTKAGEIGSSAMPHKVNPIDFENAEGNLGIANALYGHLSGKLPVSRLQRDLTDSTVLRVLGMPVAHSFLSLLSLEAGLGKLLLNETKLDADLEANWAVVAEAIQTILRREAYPQPYEALKELTRGKGSITAQTMRAFIHSLDVPDVIKAELLAVTPQNYVGRM